MLARLCIKHIVSYIANIWNASPCCKTKWNCVLTTPFLVYISWQNTKRAWSLYVSMDNHNTHAAIMIKYRTRGTAWIDNVYWHMTKNRKDFKPLSSACTAMNNTPKVGKQQIHPDFPMESAKLVCLMVARLTADNLSLRKFFIALQHCPAMCYT